MGRVAGTAASRRPSSCRRRTRTTTPARARRLRRSRKARAVRSAGRRYTGLFRSRSIPSHRAPAPPLTGIEFAVEMAALAASALRPPAGRFLLPRCNQASVSGQRRPPLLKVAKPQTGVRRSACASVRIRAAASDHGRQELRTSEYQVDDDEPLWLAVIRDLSADLRGLVAFLAEQPRQLKYLEWPGFQNTLKTAALALILVAIFIVALSTVDAALCYIMAWLLRKSA